MRADDEPGPLTVQQSTAGVLVNDERADRAWQLRVAGLSWAAIARECGYANTQNARRSVARHYGSVPEPERQDLRALWRDRLEQLWLQSTKDVLEQRPGAITAGVRIVMAAAALDGLNAPTVIESHTTTTFQGLLVELRKEELL